MRFTPISILAAMMLSALAAWGSGAVDPNFGNSPWPFQERGDSEIREIALTPSGKVLISTYFAGLVRLNFDGSIDPTFTCAVPRVRRVTAAGAKIYVAHGPEFFPDGTSGYHVSRLNEDGSVDGSFARVTLIPPHHWNVYVVVRSMAPTLDGGCIIGGLFDKTNEGVCTNIARFKANGSLDKGFANNLNPSPQPYSICPLPNGQFILSEAIWDSRWGYY